MKLIFKTAIYLSIFGILLGTIAISGTVLYLSPKLPDVNQIRDIQLQIPLRVFTQDGKLIAEFGEQRRSPLSFEEIPEGLVKAVLAAEDDRFYEHKGVDIKGLARASLELLKSGRIQTGGSTITMQVAKNFFLTRERTFIRKFNEILLALQLERKLTKQEIFELYANKIYLGNRAYGFAAAAKVYYGKNIPELNLAQLAMIAGLPKAPSSYNPIANPERAKQRRNWIIKRMLLLNDISQELHDEAINASVTAKYHGLKSETEASYIAEMVRQEMLEKLGKQAYTEGYHVYTTLDSKLQKSAVKAIQHGLMEYSERHGFRGPEQRIEITTASESQSEPDWADKLKDLSKIGPLEPAVVLQIEESPPNKQADWHLIAGLNTGSKITLKFEDLLWARKYKSVNSMGPKPKKISDILQIGDVIRVYSQTGADKPDQESVDWKMSQVPRVQGALVSINPQDGRVRALTGGFDYHQSKFNRAIQGGRQAGSSFKPFIYSAGLNQGLTPASIINDAPIVFNDKSLETAWRPENSSGTFFGPTRLRKALYKSRNLVSIRLLKQIGIKHAINYTSQFGFPKSSLPNNLSLALGSATLTPLQIAMGYSTLANGGYKVNPYFIEKITDNAGNLIYQHETEVACTNKSTAACASASKKATRIMDERVHFLIQDMLKDVIKKGTGRKALALGRNDIAGKTGTTNDQRDAWFSGYHPNLVATVWVGFDKPSTLGAKEYGGTAALPIWIKYMGDALTSLAEHHFPLPEEMVSVRIDPETGNRAVPNQSNAIFEFFRAEKAPEEFSDNNPALPTQLSNESKTIEALF